MEKRIVLEIISPSHCSEWWSRWTLEQNVPHDRPSFTATIGANCLRKSL